MTEAEWLVTASSDDMLNFIGERVSHRKLRLLPCACCHPLLARVDTPGISLEPMFIAAELFADGLIPVPELLNWFPDREVDEPPFFFEIPAYFDLDALGQRTCNAIESLGWSPIEEPNWYEEFIGDEPVPRRVPGLWPPGGYAQDRTRRALERASNAWALLESGCPYPGNPETYGTWDNLAGVPDSYFRYEREARTRFSVLLRDIFGNPFRPVTFSPAWRISPAIALAAQMYESRDFGAMPILADALQDAGCDNTDILDHCRGEGPHVRGCWVVDLVLGKE